MHQQVRTDLWGYQPQEALDSADLIAERYEGIRPAPATPPAPSTHEKVTLWELLDVRERTGIELTESMAMWPGASVSGWYFSHPQSQYFVVGRLGRDQVESYAERKGWTLAEASAGSRPTWATTGGLVLRDGAPTDAARPGHGRLVLVTATRAPALPSAVLWDMDGTLVDTEPLLDAGGVDAGRAPRRHLERGARPQTWSGATCVTRPPTWPRTWAPAFLPSSCSTSCSSWSSSR